MVNLISPIIPHWKVDSSSNTLCRCYKDWMDGIVQLRRPDMDPSEAAALQCTPASPVSDDDLAEAAHFSHYAFAAYGYMLYVFSKPE